MRYWPEILVQVFKNGPSKIYGRQPLKIFAWSILQYLDPYVNVGIYGLQLKSGDKYIEQTKTQIPEQ